jgi:hypothetical protein
MNLPFVINPATVFDNIPVLQTRIADFGERFINSKYARPYRHKSRKALANWRSGNKKKLRQFAK